jgi:hypothetical protein
LFQAVCYRIGIRQVHSSTRHQLYRHVLNLSTWL